MFNTQQLTADKQALDDKITQLDTYVNSEEFQQVEDPVERDLTQQQLTVMSDLSIVLGQCINHSNKPAAVPT